MQKTARLPTMPASKGALTRNPLPIMEARGVRVAFHLVDLDSFLEVSRKTVIAIVNKMISPFIMAPTYHVLLRISCLNGQLGITSSLLQIFEKFAPYFKQKNRPLESLFKSIF